MSDSSLPLAQNPFAGIALVKKLDDGRYLVTRSDGVNFSLTPEMWRDVADLVWSMEFQRVRPEGQEQQS